MGIAILDEGGMNYIPVNTNSTYTVAPYAKLVGRKYVPWVEGVDPVSIRIDQIVLLKVTGATMGKGGKRTFAATVVGLFPISKEIETEFGRNKARLVE